MQDLIVIRGDGNIDGGEISSPLLTTPEACIARGWQEVEAHALATSVQLRAVFQPGVRKGQLVEVIDRFQGPSWRGTIMGISLVCEGPTVFMVLTVEKPNESD